MCAQTYILYLECRIDAANGTLRDRLREALSEARQIHRLYDLLYFAYQPRGHHSAYERRVWLKQAIELLGEEDFYAGKLPPPAPFWRFTPN